MIGLERRWLLCGLVGIALVVLGAFAPLAHLQQDNVSLWGSGHGNGMFVLAIAALSVGFLAARKQGFLPIAAIAIAMIVVVSFLRLCDRIGQGHGAARLDWGWIPLTLGIICLLAGGPIVVQKKQR